MSSFLGLEDVEYISHGNWSDSEIKYDDGINVYSFNYYDLEEGLLESYNSDFPQKEISFDEYIKSNTDIVYSELENLVNNYWETMLQNSPFKELENLKEKYGIELFNQSLKYQLKAIESEYPEYLLDYYKIQELEVTSEDDLYSYLMKVCFDLGKDSQYFRDSNIPQNIEKEIRDYIKSKELMEKNKLFSCIVNEKDLETGVNNKINDSFYLSYWYDSNGEGIYYEIRDLNGKEIDGGLQLFGLENSRPEVSREILSISLLKLSRYNTENIKKIEHLPNGNLEYIVNFENEQESEEEL